MDRHLRSDANWKICLALFNKNVRLSFIYFICKIPYIRCYLLLLLCLFVFTIKLFLFSLSNCPYFLPAWLLCYSNVLSLRLYLLYLQKLSQYVLIFWLSLQTKLPSGRRNFGGSTDTLTPNVIRIPNLSPLQLSSAMLEIFTKARKPSCIPYSQRHRLHIDP